VPLDRASDVGRVSRDNDYPRAAVDVESNLYSLSFAPNPNWAGARAPNEATGAVTKETSRCVRLVRPGRR
jgi:cation diffusion facilitator CzcD-associated flavoprotein CzcO